MGLHYNACMIAPVNLNQGSSMSIFSRMMAAVLLVLSSSVYASQVWIADWKTTSPFSAPRAGTAAVVVKNKIYLIGGVDGRSFVNTTEFAQIQNNGALGPWQPGPALNEERGFIDAVVHGDYVYVVGGGNDLNGHNLLRSAERARIHADGTLGPWQQEKNQMVLTRRCSKLIATDKRLYAFGGFGGALLDSVEYAEFQPDGSLGEWKMDTELMTIPRYVGTVKKSGGRFFVIGGHDQTKGVGITNVEWSRPGDTGALQKWQAAAPMQQGRYSQSGASHDNFIYALGGISGAEYLDSIERTAVGKDGKLSPWQFTTPLDQPRANFSTIDYQGHLYVIGGTNRDGYLNSVIYAEHNKAGDLGYWGSAQQAQALKDRLQQREQKNAQLPYSGLVEEVIQTEGYTYLMVTSPEGGVWIAGPKMTDIKPGDHVGFSSGVDMPNWYSKELKRAFEMVLFVGQVQKQ